MQVRTASKARDGGAPSRRREGAGGREVAGLLADDRDDRQGPLAGRFRERAGIGRLVRAAAAGAGLLPLAADGRAGAEDPRGTPPHQLGRDAPAVPLRSPPLDDRTRPAPQRSLQAPASERAPDDASL